MPPRRKQAAKTRAAAAKATRAAKKVSQEEEESTQEENVETEDSFTSALEESDQLEVSTEQPAEDVEIVQADDSEELAEANNDVEETYEEGTDTQQPEADGVVEEAALEVTEEGGEETAEAEGEGQPAEDEGNLFAIDKAPMDDEEMASKIDSKDDGNQEEGKVWPKPEKELPLRGRVLRIHPIRMQDVASKSAAPILRASLGYIIRSEGGGKPQKKNMDFARSLEIWFHSEEEAEEMFVRMCKFNWNVNGRPARIVRVNTPESVDVTLKEWDKSIAPFGMYDGRCLFVNHVPANTTDEDLKQLFENTKKIVIPTDEEGNQQGYALIEFWSKDEAVESSKKKLTMGEAELTLHTLGIQRIPRSKASQERLEKEMKRIREQGVSTDYSKSRNPHDDRRDGRRQGGGRNQRDGRRQTLGGGGGGGGGNRRDGRRSLPGRRDEGGWGNKRRNSGGREFGSPNKRGRMDSGGRFGGGGGGGGGGRNRGRFAGGRGGNVDNIRGELLNQMQNLQQGGLSDPSYLMNLAKRLQQAQGGGY